MKVKTVNACTLDDVLAVWNEGFSNYFVPISMNLSELLERVVQEEISLEHSFIVYDDLRPVGILLNAFRTTSKRMAWNGGTAIVPDYRGKGVSTLLMKHTLEMYAEQNIDVAYLEAISENEKAISLYEKYGYTIEDELIFAHGLLQQEECTLQMELLLPEQFMHHPLLRDDVPWQCRPQSVNSGEVLLFHEGHESEAVGYVIMKRIFADNVLQKIALYQIEATHADYLQQMLNALAAFNVPITTINVPKSNPVWALLPQFQINITQVHMKRTM